jgi:uncharacterized protein YdhG (YjbR/CyaY superfamily)
VQVRRRRTTSSGPEADPARVVDAQRFRGAVSAGDDRWGEESAMAPGRLATVDDYIASFPDEVQVALEEVRRTIRTVVPSAGETISYRIPSITLDGAHLVYFAAWKHHISVYPVPAGDEAFEREIAPYRASKGTVRFPLGKPVPCDLVERLVALLVNQRAGGAP